MGRGRGRVKANSQGWKVRPPLSETAVARSDALTSSGSNLPSFPTPSPLFPNPQPRVARKDSQPPQLQPVQPEVEDEIDSLSGHLDAEKETENEGNESDWVQIDAEKNFLEGR